jgi:hypothetical protein
MKMALLDSLKKIPERIGKNLERNIGGLLGEDLEGLSEEERRAIRRQAAMAVFDAMARGTTPGAGLERVAALTAERLQARRQSEAQGRAAQDIQQAQAAIAGRLGARGVDVGEQTQLEEVRPMSGMNLPALVASPAGAAAMQMNPQLAEMLKQRTGYQVAGADIFNRETGQFIPRPNAAPSAARVGAPSSSGAKAPVLSAARYQTLTPEQLQQANLPEGTSAQLDTQTGQIKVISAVPTQQRTGEAAKGTAVKRVDDVASRIESQMGNVRTGGPLGVVGALSRVFDSQDAKLFESYRQQLSSALRTALRIPGEGALSDFEQRQYGLQLPELGQSAENNRQILRSLQNQVRLAANMPPLEEAAQGGGVDYIFQNGRLVPARQR